MMGDANVRRAIPVAKDNDVSGLWRVAAATTAAAGMEPRTLFRPIREAPDEVAEVLLVAQEPGAGGLEAPVNERHAPAIGLRLLARGLPIFGRARLPVGRALVSAGHELADCRLQGGATRGRASLGHHLEG